MEMNAPWITCRMGKKLYLLAKDDKAYYLIEVGKNLDYATEEWLERRGVSEALLKELLLPFTYIPRNVLRGVAFTGHEAGDYVYLYLKSEKKKLLLELDHGPDWMDRFFPGIQRLTAPKTKAAGEKGWRKERQDKDLFEKLKIVPPAFLISGVASGVGWMLTRHRLLFTACLILCAAQVALALCFPVYFTLYLPKGKRKQNVWNLDLSLWCTGGWLLFGISGDWMDLSAFRWVLPLGIGMAVVIYWRVRDLHQDPWSFLSCLFLCCFCAVYITGQANIVYDTTPGETWVLEVEDLRSSGGRSRHYYCSVTLPDGRTEEISISRSLYLDLEEGDFVRVEQNVGALGMAYTRVYPIEEG